MLPSIFGEDLFDDMFDDMYGMRPFFGNRNPLYGKNAKNLMKSDIRETDDAYELDIDLPGFKKEEVNLKLDQGYLTIAASKGLDKDDEDKKGHYIRRERFAGACSRSFYVGDQQAGRHFRQVRRRYPEDSSAEGRAEAAAAEQSDRH